MLPSTFRVRLAKWSSPKRSTFPGAVSQGFDLPDARLMIGSAMEDLAESLIEEGKPLPVPDPGATLLDADLVELIPLPVHAGSQRG